jgi:hypothetical protein
LIAHWLLSPAQQLEVDAEPQNRRNPRRYEYALLVIAGKKQIDAEGERNYDRHENEHIGFADHVFGSPDFDIEHRRHTGKKAVGRF